MWPWEHILLGYVLYSLYSHVWHRRPPSDRAAIVVAVASVLPDVIDKPLAWQFAVLPGGRSLAHSLFFALPAITVVYLLARWAGADDVGAAFGVGYLSHLPSDSFYPLVMSGETVDLGYLIWPLASASGSGSVSVVEHVLDLLSDFSGFVSGPEGWRFLLVEGTLLALALALWTLDGWPGLGTVRRGFGRVGRIVRT